MAALVCESVKTTVPEFADHSAENDATRSITAPAQPRTTSRRPRNLPPLSSALPALTPRPPSPDGKKRPQRRMRNGCANIDCDDSTIAQREEQISPQSSVSSSEASTAASSGTSTRRPSVSSSGNCSRESSCGIVRRAADRLRINGRRRASSAKCHPLRCPDVGATAWSLVFTANDGALTEARRDDVRTVARELLRQKRGSSEAHQLAAQLEQLKLQSPS